MMELARRISPVSFLLEVPFHDLDMMEVVWHGHYLKYMEQARTLFFRALGCDYSDVKSLGYVFPVVDLKVRYHAPARYGMQLRVQVRALELEHRIKLHYLIEVADSKQKLLSGETTQVAVSLADGSLCMVIPDALRERFLLFTGLTDADEVEPC